MAITSAFQADDEGSIPSTCSNKRMVVTGLVYKFLRLLTRYLDANHWLILKKKGGI